MPDPRERRGADPYRHPGGRTCLLTLLLMLTFPAALLGLLSGSGVTV